MIPGKHVKDGLYFVRPGSGPSSAGFNLRGNCGRLGGVMNRPATSQSKSVLTDADIQRIREAFSEANPISRTPKTWTADELATELHTCKKTVRRLELAKLIVRIPGVSRPALYTDRSVMRLLNGEVNVSTQLSRQIKRRAGRITA